MRERICKRCGAVGEWRKCRVKVSKYHSHYLCGMCTILVTSIAKQKPRGELAKKKMRASRKLKP